MGDWRYGLHCSIFLGTERAKSKAAIRQIPWITSRVLKNYVKRLI